MRLATAHGGAAIINNLRTADLLMSARFKENLSIAALFLQAEAIDRTPIDTGNLRGSSDVDMDSISTKGGPQPIAHVFYTASYAIFVHENLTAHHEVGMAKFLERAAVDNVRQIREILRKGLI